MRQREIELQDKSGKVSTSDPLTVFIYLLLKDYMTTGEVEAVLEQMIGLFPGYVKCNNGWMGLYAKNVKDKIEELREANDPKNFGNTESKIEAPVMDQLRNTMSDEDYKRFQEDVEEFKKESK